MKHATLCAACGVLVTHPLSTVHIRNDAKQNSTNHESNKDKLRGEEDIDLIQHRISSALAYVSK